MDELPQIQESLQGNVSKAVEAGMPLDTPLYGARGETLKDLVDIKKESKPALDDPIFMEESTPSVDTFLTSSQPTIDELVPDDGMPTVIVNNRPSNVAMAAKVAALSDEKTAVNDYRAVSGELESGSADAFNKRMADLETKTLSSVTNTVVDMLQDPDISEEEKIKIMSDFQTYQVKNFSINKALATEALIEDDGDTPERTNVRINTGVAIDEVLDSKRQIQTLLNQEVAKSDSSLMTAYADAFAFFTPYMEQKYFSGINPEKDRNWLSKWAFMGDTKKGLRNAIMKMPPEERVEAAKHVIDIINAQGGIALSDSNDYARVEALRVALEEGYYTDEDQFVDNLFSMLDVTIVGGEVGRFLRLGAITKLGGKVMAESAERYAKRLATRSKVQPTSVSQIYKDTNVTKAKNLHEAVAADETGELAEATYGASRTEAVANDIMPEIASPDGAVRSKVGEPESIHQMKKAPDEEMVRFTDSGGAIHYWSAEKNAMRSKVVNDFKNAVGVENRKEMNQIEEVAGGVNIKAVYGVPQYGYENAADALETVKVSLRQHGITDDDLTLLGNFNGTYRPIKLEDLQASKVLRDKGVKVDYPTDYLVQVDHKYRFNPMDVTKWYEASVRNNFFDRIPSFFTKRSGSVSRHLLDVASMLHPKLTLGANVAIDKAAGLEKRLLTKAADFSDNFVKLKGERQTALMDYFKQANKEGLAFNKSQLKAQFSDDEIEIIQKWRDYWDDMYWLDNQDLIRTLNAQGYQYFIDDATDTKLFAKPINRQQAGNHVRVYDQASDKIVEMKADELTKLYEANGTVAKLRTPMKVGDDAAEYVVAHNKAGASYTRRISEGDAALRYRNGYFTVRYTAPKYIDKIVRDSKGKELYRQAVAVAGNTKDAELMAKRLKAQDDVNDYIARGDIKSEYFVQGQDGIDVMQAAGRTSQRTRGKRLEDANAPTDFDSQYVMGPVDSMVLAARSTAERVSLRDYMEATKSRFLEQFKEFCPTNKYGQPQFPSSIDQLRKPGGMMDKDIADARTTFEYIDYLEKGYINALDEGYKAILNSLANVSGKYTAVGENVLRKMAQVGPTSLMKNTAFQLYLASNPLRQFVVQSHQLTQLFAYNPVYAGRQMAKDGSLLIAHKMGLKVDDKTLKKLGRTRKEYEEMTSAWERSGFSAAVDKNSLINGSLTQLVEDSRLAGRKRPIGKLFNAARKVGFDAGEEINLMTAWLAHRDKLIKQGKYKGAELDDMVTGMARNFTYNMNRAGDIAYNQNMLGMVFQFMQVPHKAFTTMTFNRVLSKSDKAKLITFNASMYSLPPAAMYSWFGDSLPEDPELRELVVQGLEPYIFNKLLSTAYGDDVSIDFSGLSPADLHGVQTFLVNLWTTDAGTILASTPSSSLLFGHNPRIRNAAQEWARLFGFHEQDMVETDFETVLKTTASLSSGMSNYFKAATALREGRIVSGVKVTDASVSTPEAIAKLFGFPTMDEAKRAWIGNEQYAQTKAFKDDVTKYYKGLKAQLGRQGVTVDEQKYVAKIMSHMSSVFGPNEAAAREIVLSLIKRDVRNGDMTLFNNALKMTQYPDAKNVRTMIENIPDQSYKKKQQMLDSLTYIDNWKDE